MRDGSVAVECHGPGGASRGDRGEAGAGAGLVAGGRGCWVIRVTNDLPIVLGRSIVAIFRRRALTLSLAGQGDGHGAAGAADANRMRTTAEGPAGLSHRD